MNDSVLILRERPLTRIRLHRPQRRNAFDGEMISGLSAAFASVAKDAETRVVILEGEGPVFCGGADLEYMKEQSGAGEEENRAQAARMGAMFAAIASCPRPVIAAVQGAALGGGCGLAAAADIAVSASDAVFGFTEVRLGLIPAVISPFILAKVRPGDARRYFLTGERFDAAEAWRIGLVQAVGGPGSVSEEVRRMVDLLLAGAPCAQGEIKDLLRLLPQTPSSEVSSMTAGWIARLRGSKEGREGMAAFLERRAPSWAPERPDQQ